MKPEIERVMMMIRYVLVLMIGAMLAACSGGGTATSPTPAPPPVATTFSLSGRVTDSATATAIAGATVSIADSINAGKTATTDASGNYSFTGLQQAGFTVNAVAAAYRLSAQSATLTTNLTLNFSLAQQSFAGNWSGATQQGSINGLPSITFAVSNTNTLTALNMRFAGASSCGISGFSFPGILPAITNSSFTWSDSRPMGTFSVLVREVKGTFRSDSTASGTATLELNSRSCPGASLNLTWTAVKQ